MGVRVPVCEGITDIYTLCCFPQVRLFHMYCPERADKASVNARLHTFNADLNYQWNFYPLLIRSLTFYTREEKMLVSGCFWFFMVTGS